MCRTFRRHCTYTLYCLSYSDAARLHQSFAQTRTRRQVRLVYVPKRIAAQCGIRLICRCAGREGGGAHPKKVKGWMRNLRWFHYVAGLVVPQKSGRGRSKYDLFDCHALYLQTILRFFPNRVIPFGLLPGRLTPPGLLPDSPHHVNENQESHYHQRLQKHHHHSVPSNGAPSALPNENLLESFISIRVGGDDRGFPADFCGLIAGQPRVISVCTMAHRYCLNPLRATRLELLDGVPRTDVKNVNCPVVAPSDDGRAPLPKANVAGTWTALKLPRHFKRTGLRLVCVPEEGRTSVGVAYAKDTLAPVHGSTSAGAS